MQQQQQQQQQQQRADYEPLNRNRLIALLGVIFAESSPGCTFVTDSVTSEGLESFLQDTLGLHHVRYLKGYANVIEKARELNNNNNNNNSNDTYIPPIGKSLLFFGWNGILLVVEDWVGRERWQAMVKPYPVILVSLCVNLMALPVSHLFTGDLLEEGFFDDTCIALPMIRISRSAY